MDRLGHEVGWLALTLTDACNLRCRYCAVDAGAKGQFLGHGKANEFLQFFSAYAIPKVRVYLTGGEPTLHPHMLEVVDTVNSEYLDPDLIIATNGVIPQDLLGDLISRKATFYLTFEGLPRFQDFERPLINSSGSSDMVIRTIERIVSEDPDQLLLRFNMSKNKLNHQVEVCDFLEGLGVKRVSPASLTPKGRGCDYENVDRVACVPELPGFAELLHERGIDTRYSKFRPYEDARWLSCGAGYNTFGLTVDAKVVTCQSLHDSNKLKESEEKFVVGEVGRDGVELDFDKLASFRDFAFKVPEECSQCPAKSYCGGCPWARVNPEFCETNQLIVAKHREMNCG